MPVFVVVDTHDGYVYMVTEDKEFALAAARTINGQDSFVTVYERNMNVPPLSHVFNHL
jgi:hypothetical protein